MPRRIRPGARSVVVAKAVHGSGGAPGGRAVGQACGLSPRRPLPDRLRWPRVCRRLTAPDRSPGPRPSPRPCPEIASVVAAGSRRSPYRGVAGRRSRSACRRVGLAGAAAGAGGRWSTWDRRPADAPTCRRCLAPLVALSDSDSAASPAPRDRQRHCRPQRARETESPSRPACLPQPLPIAAGLRSRTSEWHALSGLSRAPRRSLRPALGPACSLRQTRRDLRRRGTGVAPGSAVADRLAGRVAAGRGRSRLGRVAGRRRPAAARSSCCSPVPLRQLPARSRRRAMSAVCPSTPPGVSTMAGAPAARIAATTSSGSILPLPRLSCRSGPSRSRPWSRWRGSGRSGR